MTIKEVKELVNGKYVDVEYYKSKTFGKYFPNHFHTDNCMMVELGEGNNYSEDSNVAFYELMNEEDYNTSLYSNCSIVANFEEWYNDKNAKVLCIMLS
jgi:hypothetical protein